MPWVSKAQAAWGHSPAGLSALGGPAKVKEWDSATKPGSLPTKVSPLPKIKEPPVSNWIKKAIRHPGAMTQAAKKAKQTNSQYEQAHKNSPGKAGERARLAITLGHLHN